MGSIMANGTWKTRDHSFSCKQVRCKWVFKKKLKFDGAIDKYKANLMAKGYTKMKEKTSLIHTHLLLQ